MLADDRIGVVVEMAGVRRFASCQMVIVLLVLSFTLGPLQASVIVMD